MSSKQVFCPVGNHVDLGYVTKGKPAVFICKECGFVFSWNEDGKIVSAVKVVTKPAGRCGCRVCEAKESR